jgi:hypothetical protein
MERRGRAYKGRFHVQHLKQGLGTQEAEIAAFCTQLGCDVAGAHPYAEIVERVDQIIALLFAASTKALATDNQAWLKRYAWFANIVDDLAEDRPGTPLEG